jgi:hypothetical protein
MTRGLGGHSPANVTYYLKGIQFPADKRDLLRLAERNGADDDVLDVLEAFPNDEWWSVAEIMKAYGEVDEGGRFNESDRDGRRSYDERDMRSRGRDYGEHGRDYGGRGRGY